MVLTYTSANQNELRTRLARFAGDHPNIEVRGWFSFLLDHFARPFLPFLFAGKRVNGFDFHSPPQQYSKNTDWARYFNEHGEARKVHLPQLAVCVEAASKGAGIRRIERLYDRIFIDETQDLSGYDLEILKLLMRSDVPIEMVGDIRQAILATNDRERKNKQYMYMGIWAWFQAEEKKGRLTIEQRCETWRCSPAIARFADSLFGDDWGFAPTVSLNDRVTGHDGIFLVARNQVDSYMERYAPLPLRYSAGSGKRFEHLDFRTFGEVKGLGREHVLIYPTGAIMKFVEQGTALAQQQAARFYVAVTRAEQSVGIIVDKPVRSTYPLWTP
ncbi:UvrD-helicase domain-containing protein [Rhodococcus sp. NPDC059968]|uniref:UvrD-helicase domain-containing protein n=1 Tax=Rhodococcus sp. NPDC059968 TaxID=3347017 RepID=UPI0036733163